MSDKQSRYTAKRPWNRITGYGLENEVIKAAYEAMPKDQQLVIENMRERFCETSGVTGLGIISFLDLLLKVEFKDDLDQLAEVAARTKS